MAATSTSEPPVLSQLAARELVSSEWQIDNEAGAHAASTQALEHTHGHHGLLVATAGGKKHVVLSRLDMRGTGIELDEDGRPRRRTLADLLDLGWSLGAGGATPQVQSFELAPLPRWTCTLPGVDGELTIEIALHATLPAVSVRYDWEGDDALRLHLRPLLAMRSIDERGKEHGAMSQGVEVRRGETRVRPRRDLPPVCFAHGGIFVGSPDWWLGSASEASERAFVEDLWTPGVIEAVLEPGQSTAIVCSLGSLPEGWPAFPGGLAPRPSSS
ncbi:MAG: glycogen debranching enzyme N-terminal domain-containing protein [Polyangiales bacterium]